MRPQHVLLVDDAQDSLEMYSDYLRHSGFSVSLAVDGQQGVAKALRKTPDAIVMDLQMPGLDGFEATRRLKADTRTRHVPIIVLTGNGLSGHSEALLAGCDAFLVKPCLPADLVGVIRSMLDVSYGSGGKTRGA